MVPLHFNNQKHLQLIDLYIFFKVFFLSFFQKYCTFTFFTYINSGKYSFKTFFFYYNCIIRLEHVDILLFSHYNTEL